MTIPYESSFASHPRVSCWHPTKNGDIKPRNFWKNSHTTCWFKCDKCPHDFEKRLDQINSKGTWCPYCSEPAQKLCEDEECRHCFENSFASNPKASYWHPNENGSVKPRDVIKGSAKKHWFKCDNCSHDFEAGLNFVNKGTWCPYCSNPSQKMCEDEECRHCLENSFASQPKALYWHPTKNGNIKPCNVFKSSGKKHWFKCDKCSHDFEKKLCDINKGGWCPYCSNPPQKMCEDEECQHCFENSFASNPKASYWHPTKNGDVKPRNVFKKSGKKCWFKCDKCSHDFYAQPFIINQGVWCPMCVHKTEQKLYEALIGYHRGTKRQFRAKWCKNIKTNCLYPFDFCIESKKVIIELDGRQHFEDVKHWKSSFEDRHSVDLVKQLDANDNGYRVIRITQEDVWTDRYDWLTELLKNIEDDTHQNVFMCKDGEYDFFIESINHLKSASAV